MTTELMEVQTPSLPRYRDLYFRIFAAALASHIIIVYGEPESSFRLMLTRDYYTAFAGSFLIAFLLIQSVYGITVFLDRRFEWIDSSLKRVGAQIVLGIGAPGIGAFLLATLYFKIRGIDILRTSYEAYDFPFILLMITLLNAYYLGYYFFLKWREPDKAAKEYDRKASNLIAGNVKDESFKETEERFFMVSKGSASVPISYDAIAYFFRDGDANFLRSLDGEDFFITASLEEAELSANQNGFFRINRQLLASFAAVEGFQPAGYGKLSVKLNPPFKGEMIVSQKRARPFRQWADLNT